MKLRQGWDPIADTLRRLELRETARAAEAARIAAARSAGAAPDGCGPEIVRVAPARGPVMTFVPARVIAVGSDGVAVVDRGHKGRRALRRGDAFDRMAAASRSRKAGAPFAADQVAAGRAYADLSERVAAEGYGTSAAFRDSPGGDRDRMAQVMARRAHLERCHRLIGTGIAKEVRRRRPSQRYSAVAGERRVIFDRTLVDMICIEGRPLQDVLEAHGWSRSPKNIKAAEAALRAALSRLSRCF